MQTLLSGVLLTAILILTAVLRLASISSTQAEFDELWHLELSTGRGSAHATIPLDRLVTVPVLTSLAGAPPWYVIPVTLDGVTHPPLYSLVLRFWRTLAGESITAGRVLSVLLSVLCVAMLYFTMRPLHGAATALWACLLMALSDSLIQIGQEIRNYPLMILACLAAAAVLLRIERFGVTRTRLILLGIATLAALFTHYFVAPALAAMGIYALLRFRGRSRWMAPAVMLGMLLLFIVVWGPMARRQAQAFADAKAPGALADPSPNHLSHTLTLAAAAPLRLLFTPRSGAATVAMLSAAIFVLPLLMLRGKPQLLLWWLWLVLVIGFAAALDLAQTTQHLEQLRHTILAAPAMCALLVIIVSGERPLLAHGAPALLGLACAAAIGAHSEFHPRYAELGRSIARQPAPASQPLIVYSDPGQEWWSGWLLLACSQYSGTFPRPVLRLSHPATGEQVADLRRWDGAWLVWMSEQFRPAEILPGIAASEMNYDDPILASARHVRWTPTTAPGTAPAE
jgi:uncharacterized membrane protein